MNVKDFRQSWSNGLAFCAILHSFLPDKIPYDDLTPDNPRKNFTIAFQAALLVNHPSSTIITYNINDTPFYILSLPISISINGISLSLCLYNM